MADERLRNELNTLERKLKLFLTEHQKLREEVSQYRIENDRLKMVVSKKDNELQGFQNNIKIVKLVENMMAGGEGSAELKEVLEVYIKEIDKCIAHLSEA